MRYDDLYIMHYGTKGMSWGNRRYQNPDGSLTEEGKRHYGRNTSALLAIQKGTSAAKKAMGWNKGGVTTTKPVANNKTNKNVKILNRASKVTSKTSSDLKAKSDAMKTTENNAKDSANEDKTPKKMSSSSIWENPTNGSSNHTLGMLTDFSSEKELKDHLNATGVTDKDEQKKLLEAYKDVQNTLRSMPMDWQEILYNDAPDLFKGGNVDIAASIKKNFTKTMESLGVDVSNMTKKQKIIAKALTAKMIDDGLKKKKPEIKHTGVAHDENPPGPGSGRYAWGTGERAYQHMDRVYTDDTVKLDDLKTPDKYTRSFVNGNSEQQVNSQNVQQNSNVGKNQVRVKNPNGNGTITMDEKIKLNKKIGTFRYKEGQGRPWRDSYYTSTTSIKKIKPSEGFETSFKDTYKGLNSIVKAVRAYQDGKLDDKARKRLDKKIRKLSDEELQIVTKRIGSEKTLINDLNARNQQTISKGKSFTDTIVDTIGDQIQTAMGVAGIILAIKRIKIKG